MWIKQTKDKGLGTEGKERATPRKNVFNLAKVGVVGSNPIARSNFLPRMKSHCHAFSKSAWTAGEAVHARCCPRPNP